MEVSTPSAACLTLETGESSPLFLKSHPPTRERYPTPLAVSSGYHFGKLSTQSSPVSSESVSDVIYLKKAGPIVGGNVDKQPEISP